MGFLPVLSDILGYTSTFVWSLSFHYQWWEVYKTKSADGLSINYIFLNFIGFFYYFSYNMYAYIYTTPFSRQVHFSDLLFAIHALFMVSVHVIFLFSYPRSKNILNPYWIGYGVTTISSLLL